MTPRERELTCQLAQCQAAPHPLFGLRTRFLAVFGFRLLVQLQVRLQARSALAQAAVLVAQQLVYPFIQQDGRILDLRALHQLIQDFVGVFRLGLLCRLTLQALAHTLA